MHFLNHVVRVREEMRRTVDSNFNHNEIFLYYKWKYESVAFSKYVILTVKSNQNYCKFDCNPPCVSRLHILMIKLLNTEIEQLKIENVKLVFNGSWSRLS